MIETARIHDVHSNQVARWKKQLPERASQALEKERPPEEGPSAKELKAELGQSVMENDFSAGALFKLHGTSAKR